MKAKSEPAAPRKPRLALLIATGFGLGYIPKAPGTAGSLVGLALVWIVAWPFVRAMEADPSFSLHYMEDFFFFQTFLAVAMCLLGLWVSGRVARYMSSRDPQIIIIDEVSGQQIGLLLGPTWDLNWKYLVLGFILFRALDIWKPFPARRAERLPGGWGIMADDWVAGIYAALGLWVARALGL